MADSEDRRSRDTVQTAARKRIMKRKAAGVCGICGVTPVLNRVNCFNCVDRQVLYTLRNLMRRFLGAEEANEILKQHELLPGQTRTW